jgi:hypothetical protein
MTPRIPQVEDRLVAAKQRLAVIARFHYMSALASSADCSQNAKIETMAEWGLLALAEEAFAAVTAVYESLEAEAMRADAPNVEGV